ncbi:MAG: Multifunctional conjugation protein TraI [Pseudomonadota bacterium]|jgi:conjugative relaxase-like TrwC/TraI family protein
MLSLARVTARQGHTYYAKENYYTAERTLANSEWQGAGAEALHLRGAVNTDTFQALLEGRSSAHKYAVGAAHDNAGVERRAGIDLTFSAPKSVSLACLVGRDERLEWAHRQAVTESLKIVEERYSVCRMGSAEERSEEVTGNLIVAKFHHDTSRAKDPQMHTHCVVINAVRRSDGAWRSLHNDPLFNNSKLIGLVYQNALARHVQSLGYEITTQKNGTFELAGYSEEHLKHFSKRRLQIEELGAENQKQARRLVKINRPAKGHDIPRSELLEDWLSQSQEIGLAHPRVVENPILVRSATLAQTDELVRQGAQHATEKDVSFKREQLESFVLESHLGKVDWEKLQTEIFLASRSQEIVPAQNRLWTTRQALKCEEAILGYLRLGKDSFSPLNPASERVLREEYSMLSTGQREAVQLTLGSRDQFVAWQGVAGAGKTYAMAVIREIVSKQGIKLRGFAPSAEAANVLEIEGKIPSQTVASLMIERRPSGNTKSQNEVWIVDEAGLLAARDCEAVMQRAREANARVVMVGDTRQLSAVEAGNPFRLLQAHGISTAHLTESRRQKSVHMKEAVGLLAEGKRLEALETISAHVFELKRESTRARFIAREYLELAPEVRANCLVLAGTNRERDSLTEEIRNGLRSEGRLGDSVEITSLRARDLTREERRFAHSYQTGDVLIFHRRSKSRGLPLNVPLEVVSTDSERNTLVVKSGAESQTIIGLSESSDFLICYEPRRMTIAVNDKIKWTRNDKKIGIRNGEDFELKSIQNGEMLLQGKSGKQIRMGSDIPLHLDLNYVHTVYSSQGKTCDKVLISVDKTFGHEAMYVALSRARYEAKIITPDKDEMLATISQSRAKLSALDVTSEGISLAQANRRKRL